MLLKRVVISRESCAVSRWIRALSIGDRSPAGTLGRSGDYADLEVKANHGAAGVDGQSIEAFEKDLKGFGGAGVLEIVDDHDGDTYRAVYTALG
jgi:hypothetical protein